MHRRWYPEHERSIGGHPYHRPCPARARTRPLADPAGRLAKDRQTWCLLLIENGGPKIPLPFRLRADFRENEPVSAPWALALTAAPLLSVGPGRRMQLQHLG